MTMAACSLQVQIDSEPIRLIRDQQGIFLTAPFTMRFPVQDLVEALIAFKRTTEADTKGKVDARASQPTAAATTTGQSLPTTAGAPATQQGTPDAAAGHNLQGSSATSGGAPAAQAAERSVDQSSSVSMTATQITWESEIAELHQNHKDYVARTKWKDTGDVSVLKDKTILQNFVPAFVEAPRPVKKRPGQHGNPPTIQLPAKAPPSHLIPGSQANASTAPVPEAPPPAPQTISSGGDVSKASAPLASRAPAPPTESPVSMAAPKPKLGAPVPKSANLATDAAGKAAGVADNHSLSSPAANQVSSSKEPETSGADEDGDMSGTGGTGRHPPPPAGPPPPPIAGASPSVPPGVPGVPPGSFTSQEGRPAPPPGLGHGSNNVGAATGPAPPPPFARGKAKGGGPSETNRECQSQ